MFVELETKIKQKITNRLSDAVVDVFDESAGHRGHAGSIGYLISHLKIKVVSDGFAAMNRLQRQQLMHNILEQELKAVHSITFFLLTTKEALARQ